MVLGPYFSSCRLASALVSPACIGVEDTAERAIGCGMFISSPSQFAYEMVSAS
jgi:hypothetical protein